MEVLFVGLGGEPFVTFGISHITMLVIYFSGLIIFLLSYKKIQASCFSYHFIRWFLFSVLVLSEMFYQAWTIVNGIWSFSGHMPLHLCGIASITAATALFTHNKKLMQITFFIGLIPAFLALVTPELPYDYPHFRFWKFFIHHLAISWTSLFLIVTSSVSITFQSMLKTYIYLLVYALIIGVFINPLFDSNYLYLSHTPTASTPLDLLGSGIWYYLNLCLLAFVVFFIQLQVYRFFRAQRTNTQLKV